MITTYTVGVSGAGALTPELVADALNDSFPGGDSEVRLLVPTASERLSAGVQSVVEWAWGRDAEVVAVIDSTSSGTLVEEFLEDGPQQVIKGAAINKTIVEELVRGMPHALLLVVSEEEADSETLALIHLCQEADVPAQDLSLGLLEIDLILNPDTSELDHPPGVKVLRAAFESLQSVTEGIGSAEMDDAVGNSADTNCDLGGIEEILHDPVRAERLARTLAELKRQLEPVKLPTPAKKPTRAKMEVSFDNGKTWHPRGRGRIPAGAKERPIAE